MANIYSLKEQFFEYVVGKDFPFPYVSFDFVSGYNVGVADALFHVMLFMFFMFFVVKVEFSCGHDGVFVVRLSVIFLLKLDVLCVFVEQGVFQDRFDKAEIFWILFNAVLCHLNADIGRLTLESSDQWSSRGRMEVWNGVVRSERCLEWSGGRAGYEWIAVWSGCLGWGRITVAWSYRCRGLRRWIIVAWWLGSRVAVGGGSWETRLNRCWVACRWWRNRGSRWWAVTVSSVAYNGFLRRSVAVSCWLVNWLGLDIRWFGLNVSWFGSCWNVLDWCLVGWSHVAGLWCRFVWRWKTRREDVLGSFLTFANTYVLKQWW